MSEYIQSLPPVAKERYTKQLSLLGLDRASDDPFLSDKFIDDLTLWPPVEYGNIFCYFIERPGVYTQEQLLQWKSIDAYNYFISGHVREVKIWAPSNSLCILRAKVNPSQKSSDSCHLSWIAVKSNGQIITAHCTCMAGYVVAV